MYFIVHVLVLIRLNLINANQADSQEISSSYAHRYILLFLTYSTDYRNDTDIY